MRSYLASTTCFIATVIIATFLIGETAHGQQRKSLAEQIQRVKQQLELETKLDQTQKENLQATVGAVELNASAIATKESELLQLRDAVKTAEKRAGQFQDEFAKLKARQAETVDSGLMDDDLSVAVTAAKSEVEELKAQLKANEQASTGRIDSRKDSRQKLESLSQKIAETKTQLETAESGGNSLPEQVARLKLQTDLDLAGVEKESLLAETQRDEAEEQFALLKHQHDLIELQLKRKEAYLILLEELYGTRLELTAKKAVETAMQQQVDIQESQPLLLLSYEVNTELAKRALEVVNNASDVKANADKLKAAVESLNKKFGETKIRVKAIGLTGSVGALLRKRRADLLETTNLSTFNDDAKSKIDELQYEIFDVDQQREDLAPKQIQLEIEEAHGPQTAKTWQLLEQPINDVIEVRKTHLTAVKNSLNRLFNQLMDVQEFDSNRRATVAQFREYINERILWIRSNDILFSKLELDQSDKNAFSPSKWGEASWQVVQALGMARVEKPSGASPASVTPAKEQTKPPKVGISTRSYLRLPLSIMGALVCFLLLLMKPRMRREVDRLGVEASRGSCTSFWPTARSVFLTTLIAFALPIIPLLVGFSIIYAPFRGSVMFDALGRALIAASLFAIPVETLRRMCRPQGLANQHFDWPVSSVAKLKQNLDWVVLPGSLLIFAVDFLYNLDVSHRVDMLERILFVGGMLFAAYFLYRTFNPKTGIFSSFLRGNERSWANQTSAIWMGVILLIPVSLAILAFWGYYYTAINLATYAYSTLIFAMIVETFRGLAQRFVLVRRRNAFIQTAKRKRQAQIEARRIAREEERKLAVTMAAEKGTAVPESLPAPVESIEALTEIQPEEIEANVKQAYKLISLSLILVWVIGIWMIWADVLPALRALDDYTLWPNQVVESGLEPPAAKVESTSSEKPMPVAPNGIPITATPASTQSASAQDRSDRVTVRDLLMFIVISIVTWVAATNLPNAFEILFLEELPVDRSLRYAIKALTSYAIVMLGVVLAFRSVSIGWSNVQWLVTALTFGLAFGLQEIFANFVAGIILMFERPMRIGDLITVDQFTGVVTKIRTRATTIINWDRKEYVIPNKDFITGRLVNWTLSDAINRIEFTVGIAYGADVDLAKNTLYEICKKHPKVVEEPATQVIFSEFGDSSLNLVVKCFIGDVDSRPQVTDSLHTQINAAFNAAGIEISFPQRDLHLRTVDAGVSKAIENAKKGNA